MKGLRDHCRPPEGALGFARPCLAAARALRAWLPRPGPLAFCRFARAARACWPKPGERYLRGAPCGPSSTLCGWRGLLAGPLGLALGLFYPLAGALELFSGDPHALPGDLRLQPRALQRLRRLAAGLVGDRLTRKVHAVAAAGAAVRRRIAFRWLFSPCRTRVGGERAASVTQRPRACQP